MCYLQIVYPDGTIVRFTAGEAAELDLRAAIKDAILAKFSARIPTTLRQRAAQMLHQADLSADIEAGIEEALEQFKFKVRPGTIK